VATGQYYGRPRRTVDGLSPFITIISLNVILYWKCRSPYFTTWAGCEAFFGLFLLWPIPLRFVTLAVGNNLPMFGAPLAFMTYGFST
jgi:hypothetical protein